jgi:threonine aldolase
LVVECAAGYMAAAGLFALHNNVDRLVNDHHHAKELAHQLLEKDFVGKMMPVETNIIIFEVLGENGPQQFCERMKQKGVLCLPISATQVRMVTHLDVSREMTNQLLRIIHEM